MISMYCRYNGLFCARPLLYVVLRIFLNIFFVLWAIGEVYEELELYVHGVISCYYPSVINLDFLKTMQGRPR